MYKECIVFILPQTPLWFRRAPVLIQNFDILFIIDCWINFDFFKYCMKYYSSDW